VICGGTAQSGNWDLTVNPQTTREILEKCDKMCPGIAKAPIIGHFVGLRPARKTIRLELEQFCLQGEKYQIIHK
jgi:D-amino-acid oxidase